MGRKAAVVALFVLLVAGGTLPRQRATATSETPSAVEEPSTDGHYVVWSTLATPNTSTRVLQVATINDWQAETLTLPVTFQGSVSIDNGILVGNASAPVCTPACPERAGIWGVDLLTRQAFPIAASGGQQLHPAISGTTVVWIAAEAGSWWSIQARDLATDEEPVTLARIAQHGPGMPVMDGQRVVWLQANPAGGDAQLMLYDLTTRTIRPVAEITGGVSYDVGSDYMVYTAAGELTVVNVVSGDQQTIASDAALATTDGRSLFWLQWPASADDPGDPWPSHSELRGYDLATGQLLRPRRHWMLDIHQPGVNHGAVVWQRGSGPTAVIEGGRVSDLFEPVGLPSSYRFFPETAYSLQSGFLRYWENFGGLAVFGYPLTEELYDPYRNIVFQYFERARFEWHPGVAPERYDVLLGLVGQAIAFPQR